MAEHSILVPLASHVHSKPKTKVSIVGVGSVGMAIGFSIMTKGLASILALVDFNEDKVKGEVLDMQHGSQFLHTCNVIGGKDYSYTSHSDVVFIAAGARQVVGESRLNLVQRNVDIFKTIIPEVVKYSPDCIIVVVSNPVDILTYVTWKLSGLPRNRVIGSGTILDSARFRHILGQKLDLAASSIHGYIIGEHGDSSVAVWSRVSVGGVNLSTVYPKFGEDGDPNNFKAVHKDVIDSAYEIIRLKGYTSWAIGLCCANLCAALLSDRNVVIPVTTNVAGLYGIEEDVFLSMPCVVNASGVTSVVNMSLTDSEKAKLHQSAKTLLETTSVCCFSKDAYFQLQHWNNTLVLAISSFRMSFRLLTHVFLSIVLAFYAHLCCLLGTLRSIFCHFLVIFTP
ncbi:L lactate dehydrogenase B chain [Echinococcus multilocularis]|uniref:L-lactate dehydrogenase n=1 Tax=Echinococcus multilocularis TaxID=6211 RepID=A0A068Y9F0_ECHMU|nr:L lactate dehydrogenase B chain [Echinococcus multilocularis]